MEWDEINRRLKNGTSVAILAELDGTTYKNMYNRIKRREALDGKTYLTADQLKRPGKAKTTPGKKAEAPRIEITKDIVAPVAAFRSGYEPPKKPEPKRCTECVSFCPGFYCEEFDKDIENVLEANICQCYSKAKPDPDEVPADVYTKPGSVPEVPEEICKEIHAKMIEAEALAAKYRRIADGWRKALEAVTAPEVKA